MSQENVDVVRRHHEAFIRGDREGALEPLDPEIEFVFHLFELPVARGHAEVDEAVRQRIGTWRPGTYRFEPREYRDIGDTVLVRYREYGIGSFQNADCTGLGHELWSPASERRGDPGGPQSADPAR
jgi:ketosteroid isomerase-like protein